jgi:prepilin-type processing-associated H-X9-DG protein
MKQLTLAAIEYHDALNSFPAGWYCDGDNDPNCVIYGAQNYMWSGIPGLFQRLEAGNLFNEINFNLPPIDFANATSVRRSMDFFVCPSNRKAIMVNVQPNPQQTTIGNVRFGPSDYRGNMAAGADPTCTDPNPINCNYYENGITYRNSTINMRDITDGTTTTMLFGETLSGTWAQATDCCVRTTLDRTINRPIRINNRLYNTYWSSKHPSQVNFAKCDGSVAPVTNQINKLTLIKLMTRDAGETLTAEELR